MVNESMAYLLTCVKVANVLFQPNLDWQYRATSHWLVCAMSILVVPNVLAKSARSDKFIFSLQI